MAGQKCQSKAGSLNPVISRELFRYIEGENRYFGVEIPLYQGSFFPKSC